VTPDPFFSQELGGRSGHETKHTLYLCEKRVIHGADLLQENLTHLLHVQNGDRNPAKNQLQDNSIHGSIKRIHNPVFCVFIACLETHNSHVCGSVYKRQH